MNECDSSDTNQAPALHITVGSCRSEVDHAVGQVIELLQTLPCTCEAVDEIELALSEALANAIIHGNREDPAKKVDICAMCEGEGTLVLVITDQGQGFDPAALPDPTAAENLSLTHGRGVFLMSRLMGQVEYRLGGRQIVLRKSKMLP
ncbi:MAG: ATP-binding protein [Acidobacteriota bacterium]|nr:ATP-binding protein [Acidobacteriota bacterium]